jgi:hypothetical protein
MGHIYGRGKRNMMGVFIWKSEESFQVARPALRSAQKVRFLKCGKSNHLRSI